MLFRREQLIEAINENLLCDQEYQTQLLLRIQNFQCKFVHEN